MKRPVLKHKLKSKAELPVQSGLAQSLLLTYIRVDTYAAVTRGISRLVDPAIWSWFTLTPMSRSARHSH